MGTRFQQVSPAEITKQVVRTTFASDDGLSVPVSIYLGSQLGSKEIVNAIAEVLRVYGFSNISAMFQAPGSFYIHFEAGFKNKKCEEAHRSSEELKAALLRKKSPTDPHKRQAVKELHSSLLKCAEKKIRTGVMVGVIFLGTAIGGAISDLTKDTLKAWTVEEAPKADKFVAKEFPPSLANEFHNVVTRLIEASPQKSEVPPPGHK